MRTHTSFSHLLTAAAILIASIAVGTHFVSGASSSEETVFIPITPCRLVDTRPNETIGPRTTPLPADTAVTFTAWDSGDSNSTCQIPDTATAIGTNTTAVGPTAASFLTLYPNGEPLPNASNLNYTAGQAPTPNAATIPLSTTGQFDALNRFGTVNLIIDINGYYQPSTTIGAPGPQGPAGPANRITNNQIALLQWHQDPGAETTITVGDGPDAIAYDGTNIWVTNTFDDTVSVINPTTDAVTSTINVGDGPQGIAFDGTNMWVTNFNGDTVNVINPTTQTVTNTINTGDGPQGIAYDGTNIWIANFNGDTVSIINPTTQTVANTINVGDGPHGIAYDGTNIWIANFGTTSVINPTTQTVVNTINTGGGGGIAYDGTNIWITGSFNNNVIVINPTTQTVVNTIVVLGLPTGIAYDGTNIWVTKDTHGTVSVINPTTQTVINTINTGRAPQGIAFDGTNIWIANQFDDTVSKILPR